MTVGNVAEDEHDNNQEYQEELYELEIEQPVVQEESLPVYEVVTIYEEIVDNTNIIETGLEYSHIETDNLRLENPLEEVNQQPEE